MLAQILYPPPDDRGLEQWFFAHARQHEAIVDAFGATKGLTLQNLVLYPVAATPEAIKEWGRVHQIMHNEMNAAAGVPGTDLTDMDLKDPAKRDEFFYQHFLQHQAVAGLCGLPV